MSVYDRGYMNDSEESVFYSGRRFSAVITLIAINVMVWVAWQFAKPSHPLWLEFMRENFMVSADGVLNHYRFHTLISSALSHYDIMHIFWNMIFFWYMGEDVERIYGYRNMFLLYAFCGIIASLGHVAFDLLEHHPEIPALGASGADMGVAIIAAIFDPNKPMYFFGLLRVPLKWFVAIYIGMDLLGTFGGDDRGMGGSVIAHAAHLGGALGGFIWWKLDLRVFASPGRTHVGWLHRLRSWMRRRKVPLRIVPKEDTRETVSARSPKHLFASSEPPRVNSNVDVATSRRVDELLGKISTEGINALTDEERAFLKSSSQKYKKS